MKRVEPPDEQLLFLRDTEPAKPVRQLAKRLSQGGEPDPVLVDDALRALHPNTKPLLSRLANVAAWCAVLRAYRFEQELPRIWELVADLLQPGSPREQLQLGIQFATSVAAGQHEALGGIRLELIRLLVCQPADCAAQRVQALSVLTQGGRNLCQSGEQVVQFFISLVEPGPSGWPASEEAARAGLGAVVGLEGVVRFSSIPEPQIHQMITAVCRLCQDGAALFGAAEAAGVVAGMSSELGRKLRLGDSCLTLFDAMLRFGKVPPSALERYVSTLCLIPSVPHSRHFDTKLSWQILKHVLSSGYGQRALGLLLAMLDQPDGRPVATLRGSIFAVANACWGSDRVQLVTRIVSHSTILPCFGRVLEAGHPQILHEVALAVRRLIRRYGPELRGEWPQLLKLLGRLEPPGAEEPTPAAIASSEIAQLLVELIQAGKFKGNPEPALEWAGRFSPFADEKLEQQLVSLKLGQLSMFRPDWLAAVGELIQLHYLQEHRPSVRLRMLQGVRRLLDRLPPPQRVELLAPVLSGLQRLHEETVPEIAVEGLKLVVHAAHKAANSPHWDQLLSRLASFVLSRSASSAGKQVALQGLFALQPAELRYSPAFSAHQQQLFVLLTGLLEAEDLMVRQPVLQFLLGYHSGKHQLPAQLGLQRVPVLARGDGQRHCALGVASFVEALIRMLVTETDQQLLEQVARGICKVLEHKQLIRPSHLPWLIEVVCGSPSVLGSALEQHAQLEGWLQGLAVRIMCQLVGYSNELPEPLVQLLLSRLLVAVNRLAGCSTKFERQQARVCLDALSQLMLEQPKLMASRLPQLTAAVHGLAQVPQLCFAALGLFHTALHAVTEAGSREVVMLLTALVTTLSKAGAPELHFGHQVLALGLMQCQLQVRVQLLPVITKQLREDQKHKQLVDCTVDVLLRSTLTVSRLLAPPSKPYPDCFAGGAHSATIIGNTIASIKAGPNGFALLELRRISGTSAWVVQLQNPMLGYQPAEPAMDLYSIPQADNSMSNSTPPTLPRTERNPEPDPNGQPLISDSDMSINASEDFVCAKTESPRSASRRHSALPKQPGSHEWAARRSRRMPATWQEQRLEPTADPLTLSPWHLDASLEPSSLTTPPARGVPGNESKPCQEHTVLDPRGIFMELLMPPGTEPEKMTPISLDSDGSPEAGLTRALRVLDQTPVQETMKVGLVYVGHGQTSEQQILGNVCGSELYVDFLKEIGQFIALEDCSEFRDYTGGLDCISGSDGQYAIKWEDEVTLIIFHVATLIGDISESNTDEVLLTRKRHIGNDCVHVVFSDNPAGYDMDTISGSCNFVSIIIYPLDYEGESYRVQVKAKEGTPSFGPVGPSSSKIVSKAALANFVRMTVIHATVALSHTNGDQYTHLSNKEIRLHQIAQIKERFQR